MLIYINSYIYIPKTNIKIIYDVNYINTDENTLDAFENNIKQYIKKYSRMENLLQPYNIIKVPGIKEYFYNKNRIAEALNNNEIIVSSLFYRSDKENNIKSRYSSYCFYPDDDLISYNDHRNKFSCGSKYLYFYQSHRLCIYDSYGNFEPYISIDDRRVNHNRQEEQQKYKVGDIVKFYDSEGYLRTGIITVVISSNNYLPFNSYEIYDEFNNVLYYDEKTIFHDDIVSILDHDINKAKNIINHPDKYHNIVYTKEYINYINSL